MQKKRQNKLNNISPSAKQITLLFVSVSFNSCFIVYADTGASSLNTNAQTQVKLVEKQVVTGSRISKAEKEGPTSVTVITAAEIEKKGYSNVFDALNNLTQNTGFVQGADYGNTFTPAANAISLRGLGPNHTLTLINGHRIADYPVPYDGSVNFVNLANIPAAVIDRIEILNGGASAVYGSDAIAGVVNIILKKKTDGTQVNLKAGTTRKGGENARLQLSGSKESGKLSAVYGLELSTRQPIWASDRGFMKNRARLGETPTNVVSRRNAQTKEYLPLDHCNQLGSLFGGTVKNIGKDGQDLCSSGVAGATYWTVQTKNQSENGYLGLNYKLNDKTSLFADVLIGANQLENNTRGAIWTSLAAEDGYFLNQNSGNYEVWTKRFAPEEIGGINHGNKKWQELSTNLNLGIRGDIGDTTWRYEAAYNGSIYTSKVKRQGLLRSNIDEYLLGPRLGTDADGIGIYAPDAQRLNSPFTASEFSKISGSTEEKDKSWLQTLTLSADGEIFQLPAGAAKLAVVAEIGRQGFNIKPDPNIQKGAFFNSSSAGEYGGARSRQALGTELYLPLLKPLNLSLSGRYDRYSLSDSSIDKFTYGAGLEYRPHKTLLLRSNYATSFRAPDMNYLFLQKQKGYYASTTDYLRCEQQGIPLSNCEYNNYSPGANYTLVGNKQLKPEEGKSYGFGFVWSPTNKADISVDFWDIKIDNLVTNLSPEVLLRTEADCRTGDKDIQSAQCIDALNRIQRNPVDAVVNPNEINNINVVPINAASEHVRGIDLTTNWRWSTENWGNWLWSLNFSRVLAHDYQQDKSDSKDHLLNDKDNSDWRDRFNTSLTWNQDAWSSTVLVNRYGKIPNAGQTAFLTPTYTVNWSGAYKVTPDATVSLIVNNLFDKVKRDNSDGWPYYPTGSYSPIGRELWLELNYKF